MRMVRLIGSWFGSLFSGGFPREKVKVAKMQLLVSASGRMPSNNKVVVENGKVQAGSFRF